MGVFFVVALLAGTMPAIISAQDSNVSNSTLMEGAYGNDEIRLASIPNTTKKLTTFLLIKETEVILIVQNLCIPYVQTKDGQYRCLLRMTVLWIWNLLYIQE